MRRLLFLLTLFFSQSLAAKWVKVNDVDYIWGPFTIYNLSLYSETGQYQPNTRPLMLSLNYAKPVEGRDFAISLARSWSNLGISLPEQDVVVDRLRKMMPNIRNKDVLSYIALADRGYFILNDIVIPEEFNKDFNDAIVAVWLDERVEIGQKLLNKVVSKADTQETTSNENSEQAISAEMLDTTADPNGVELGTANESAEKSNEEKAAEEKVTKEPQNDANAALQAGENSQKNANLGSETASSPASENGVANEVHRAEKEEPQPTSELTTEPTTTPATAELPAAEPVQAETANAEPIAVEPIEVEIPQVEYPNPEIEIFPPFDPLPFYSPFQLNAEPNSVSTAS